MSSTGTAILLRPRPYANFSGTLLLLPLLPQPKTLKPLPSEIWTEIFAFAFTGYSGRSGAKPWAWSTLTICKSFNELIHPLLHASIKISRVKNLELFSNQLHIADRKWDSIRRIPYSTPGRWVQSLDLSGLAFEGQAQAVLLDGILTRLFPLTPFLSTLSINPAFVLSRGALSSLARREGSINLRSISGLSYVPPLSNDPDEDPFVQLLRHTPNIETMVVIGQGLDPTELEFGFETVELPSMMEFIPLSLPKLRVLSILAMHSSPLMLALLNTPLPRLRKLTITPYEDVPYPASLASEFITTHGFGLTSLLLFTPKSWPTRLRPSPTNLLTCAPDLNHLSLESPLPVLLLTERHGLKILSIPRPTADIWRVFERLFPFLPNLAVLRARDVRWLPKGISNMAQEAGVQGEMREWKRRLDRRKIQLLDSDWR
ncbi:hypothetical protein CVT25_002911 [Psilocybe cyanescens]|uniref:F-box domain-containing protein n=1 Tax=Psilocybe cyanescens TaxID=93625 RepID=A0A409WMX7_PSICY|nr:hypothetical protein CVT25_002911 [Psilocybe cyanescens]